jgi:hypothetical protein
MGRRDELAGEAGSGPPAWVARVPRRTSVRAVEIAWSDVPNGHWAKTAIDHVAAANDWMRDFPMDPETGTYPFKPNRLESRKRFARAVTRAFVPDAEIDPGIVFTDLPSESRFYPFANAMVQHGFMTRSAEGAFRPDAPVTMRTAHRVLVLALGLEQHARDLDGIHTRNGHGFDTPRGFGTTLLGMRLGLRYNHSDEGLDVGPASFLSRAEVAWSLYRASTVPSWTLASMDRYLGIRLPSLGDRKIRFIQWGILYVGYPYVWGGEWETASPPGYAFGSQPIGGFDCSGLTWWVMKEAAGAWDNEPPRPYAGWPLPQRTSRDMATVGRIPFDRLQVGDLMFYDGDGDGVVDHVDTYIGNGWALDSGSSNAGVTITYMGPGSWYEEHFVHGRRIIG